VATSGTDFTWTVTYTPAGDEGWNLLGNPFGSALPISSLSRTNIEETIYVWNDATNQFLADNGTTGDLTEQKIAPFQAFWVKANDSSPVLSFSLNNKATGGGFVGKQSSEPEKENVPIISLMANHSDELQSTSYFMFSEWGNLKMNTYDGHRLLPPQGVNSYLEFYSRKEKDNRLAINNLPRKFGRPLEIPLEINAFRNGNALSDDITIDVNEFKNIPEEWSIELINEKTGERFSIQQGKREYPSTPGNSVGKVTEANGKIIISMAHLAGQEVDLTNATGKVVTNRKDAHIKLTLRIDPGMDAEGFSREFYLHQNYPNPFNPTTTFNFDLALPSEVRLEIYDVIGRRVAVLVDGSLQTGSYRAVWDASSLSSGVYIARLVTSEGIFTRKLTLIK